MYTLLSVNYFYSKLKYDISPFSLHVCIMILFYVYCSYSSWNNGISVCYLLVCSTKQFCLFLVFLSSLVISFWNKTIYYFILSVYFFHIEVLFGLIIRFCEIMYYCSVLFLKWFFFRVTYPAYLKSMPLSICLMMVLRFQIHGNQPINYHVDIHIECHAAIHVLTFYSFFQITSRI